MRLIRLHADGNQRHKARMMKAQITLICITWRQPPKVSALTPIRRILVVSVLNDGHRS
jgi:hypothetical protein